MSTQSTYTIPSMDCPTEEAVIRNGLKGIAGVESLDFDLFNRRLTVTHSLPDQGPIVAALTRIGMAPGRAEAASEAPVWPEVERRATTPAGSPGGAPMRVPIASRREILLLGAAGVLAVAAEIVAWTMPVERFWPVLTLSAGAILLGGLSTLRKGLIALRTFTLNINFLMTIAVAGAFAIGEYPEAAVVVVLFAIAELIEKYSLERARNAVRALMQISPETAFVKQPDGTWRESPAGETPVGAIVRVRPGERLPLDGVIDSGTSAVDQSPITGESIPVDKGPGDQVFAGTINGNGVLEFHTTGGRDQTTLARIVRTVQEAQSQRAPTQRFVDRFARVYTPIVVILAVLVAVVPPPLFGGAWMGWIYKALVLLVIACPCALVIATPVTVVTGLAAAAKRGILIKGGVHLEQGRHLRIVALDKTGTITLGRPSLTDVVTFGTNDRDSVLRLAASLDAGSDHPVARAVTAAWTGPLLAVESFASITGRGVRGLIDGQEYFLGNARLAQERGVRTAEVDAALSSLESQGKTAIALGIPGGVLGVLAVADTPRATSTEAIGSLHRMGVRIVMLSGDNQRTAEAIAAVVGIDEARGGLLPEDKLVAIGELLTRNGTDAVGMVGDGVNDAPALAKASIGFAMGAAGTDTALETADVALMNDDLRGLPEFITLSRRVGRILKQNIAIAVVTKAAFFVLALIGLASLWMAVLADVGATIVVVANGLRAMRIGSARSNTP